MEENRRCPYCAEEIRAEAVRCRWCRSRLLTFKSERWHSEHSEARLLGVCSAVANAVALPTAAVRLGFIVLTFIHLLGPMLYLGLWLVLPGRDRGETPVERMLLWVLGIVRSMSGRDEPMPPSVTRPSV